jgi:hypothetical protein
VNSITLTRAQLTVIQNVAGNFKNVEAFIIEESNESGIGSNHRLKFMWDTPGGDKPMVVDITDVTNW